MTARDDAGAGCARSHRHGSGVAGAAVPIDEVEAASAIVQRFVTARMSFARSAPSPTETLAIAMNRLGARSNSGEGGE